MLDNFEKKVLRNYLKNLLLDKRMTQKMFSAVCDWLDDHLENIFIGEITEKTWEVLDNYSSASRTHSGVKTCQKKFIAEMTSLLATLNDSEDAIPTSPLEQSIAMLADEMKFDESDKIIFSLAVRYKIHEGLESLFDNFTADRIGQKDCHRTVEYQQPVGFFRIDPIKNLQRK